MENRRRWITYDWYKLFVALIFLTLFIVLFLTTNPAAPQTPISMPDYPPAGVAWKYDADSQSLLDTQGVARFRLSADQKSWQPVIPAEIKTSLPSGYQLSQDLQGRWVIKTAQGADLWSWDMQGFRWVEVQAARAASTLPAASSTPEPTILPTLAATSAPTSAPTAAPTTPPAELPTTIPTSTLAEALVTETPALEIITPAANSDACQALAPSRLVKGETAKVLSNLNLRNAPDIAASIIAVNPDGAVLKLLDGPICGLHLEGAYLWWQVENKEGVVGWSAENYLSGYGYFLEPVP